jgi:hypothetical protein
MCNTKTEYDEVWNIYNLTQCQDLLGRLSCSPCEPDAGFITVDSFQTITITVCESWCEQVWNACDLKTVAQNPVALCELMPNVVVSNNVTACYSSASHIFLKKTIVLFGVICSVILNFHIA